MQQAKTHCAWLLSVMYLLLFSLFLQHYFNITIFRKDYSGQLSAVNSRVGIWRYAKLETIGNPKAKILNNSDIVLIFTQLAPTLDNLKRFHWTRNSGILQYMYTDQLQHWNLSPVFSLCIIYTFFCRNSNISRNSSYRFLWNFVRQNTCTQSTDSVKHF